MFGAEEEKSSCQCPATMSHGELQVAKGFNALNQSILRTGHPGTCEANIRDPERLVRMKSSSVIPAKAKIQALHIKMTTTVVTLSEAKDSLV